MSKINVKNLTTLKGHRVVNDIQEAVECLKRGEIIARYEFGDSMSPILVSGEYCIVEPVFDTSTINVGDAVLCEVNGYLMTHMVILKSNSHADYPHFLIGSTHYDIYGWTWKIYGIAKGTNYVESIE